MLDGPYIKNNFRPNCRQHVLLPYVEEYLNPPSLYMVIKLEDPINMQMFSKTKNVISELKK